jgi:hypothetical protein
MRASCDVAQDLVQPLLDLARLETTHHRDRTSRALHFTPNNCMRSRREPSKSRNSRAPITQAVLSSAARDVCHEPSEQGGSRLRRTQCRQRLGPALVIRLPPQQMAATRSKDRFEQRLAALSQEHQRGIIRFRRRLMEFKKNGLLTDKQSSIVEEHLLRLGERNRNPANTGNIEDLFCYTLNDTKDPVRAYAQALADSVKVVPMNDDDPLLPSIKSLDRKQTFTKVGDFAQLNPGDKMLVTHTMVAYGDGEMRESAAELIRVTNPTIDRAGIERQLAKMAVQSQHHPSSTFVLARARGLTIDVADLYREAGYVEKQVKEAQRFYDICAEYQPSWTESFLAGEIPQGQQWEDWRARYIEARRHLPAELIYQLASDTLTNFLQGTLESGKWTDASVMFGGVTDARDIPPAIARIVNQYIAEHIALHDGPPGDLTLACADTLRPWGITFENDRAVVMPEGPEKTDALRVQFEAAWARKNMR